MSSKIPHQGHVARKRFGQNFLVDESIIAKIVQYIAPQPTQIMIEIGPGLGALTEPLLAAKGSKLNVIELDRDLVTRLKKRFGEYLMIHQGDALSFDFSQFASSNEQPSLRIVGNLPYNISSPLLFHLLNYLDDVIDQHFMLQNEVVERMVAVPGTKAFGRLSVMLQAYYQIDKLLDVPPESFHPAPKVNSAIVRMRPYKASERADVRHDILAEVVTLAFSQRRKILKHTLGRYQDQIDFDEMGFDLSRRAEEISVQEYIQIAQKLAYIRDK